MLKRALISASLACSGILFAILLAEMTVRIMGITDPRFIDAHPVYGWILRPSFSDWFTREGHSYVEINSQGLRDPEWSQEKPPNTIRIAVLGDSFTAALEVDASKRFSGIMASKLPSCSALQGRNVEVLNFGVNGWGTVQELLRLRNQVIEYQPDIVVLAFFTENDLEDNVSQRHRRFRPVAVLNNGQLKLDTSFTSRLPTPSALDPLKNAFYDNSRLLQLLSRVSWPSEISALEEDLIGKLQPNENLSAGDESAQDETPASGAFLPPVVYRGPSTKAERADWLVTERLLETMNQEITSRGAKFLLVTLSNGPQVYPDAAVRQASIQKLKVSDLFYADTRIHSLAEQHGIPILTLAPLLQQYADEHHVFLHGFAPHLGEGHWNQVGHQVAGELISRKLCEDVIPSALG